MTHLELQEGIMEINFLYSLRKLFILSIALCLSLLLVSCGGGGGGGGNGGDGGAGEGSNQTLATYDFNLSLLADNPLEIGSTLGSKTVTAKLEAQEAAHLGFIQHRYRESITLNGGPSAEIHCHSGQETKGFTNQCECTNSNFRLQ